MGLAYRVIPTLLARGHQLVKGEHFQSWRSVGHVAQAVRTHQARGVDELILLDIAATPAGRGPDFEFIATLTEDCFMPITCGGGVNSAEDFGGLLRAGADKVCINIARWFELQRMERICARFGSQACVAAINVSDLSAFDYKDGIHYPFWMGKSNIARRTALLIADVGFGEILLTSIDREGTMQGYDLDLIRQVSEAVSIPVIAHGGCSGPEDMLAAIEAGASAVAAGALFQFSEWTPLACSKWLLDHGVEARV